MRTQHEENLKVKVHQQLEGNKQLIDSDNIGVEVQGDSVTLAGAVGTDIERDRAEYLVRHIDGVGMVENRLEVRSVQKKVL